MKYKLTINQLETQSVTTEHLPLVGDLYAYQGNFYLVTDIIHSLENGQSIPEVLISNLGMLKDINPSNAYSLRLEWKVNTYQDIRTIRNEELT